MHTTYRFKLKGTGIEHAYMRAKSINTSEVSTADFGYIKNSKSFIDITSYWKASDLTPEAFLDTLPVEKSEICYGICVVNPVSNTNTKKSSVKHNIYRGTRKWKMVYVIFETLSNTEIGTEDEKIKAVNTARVHTENTKSDTHIDIERRLEDTDKQVAAISYRSSNGEREGEYMFYGMTDTQNSL